MARRNDGMGDEMGGDGTQEEQESLFGRTIGRAFAFFTAPPDGKASKPGKDGKPAKPKSAAQLRRERENERRRVRKGVRYGGNRRYLTLGVFAVIAALLLSVVALSVANSKVSQRDIDTAVEEALTEGGNDFPTGQATMWAGQVVRIWGTWDEENADARRVQLAPYLSSGMDEQAGWNETGSQEVIYASLNPEPRVIDQNHAVVEAVYQTQDGNWQCLSVPVYAYKPETFNTDGKWAFALGGNPAPAACSARTGAPSLDDDFYSGQSGLTEDANVASSLADTFFPGFFSAWASSDPDALAQYTASGVELVGLGGAMSSTPQPAIGTTRIWVDENGAVDGKTYQAYVPVTWTLAGTATEVTAVYVVPVVKNGERWAVAGEPLVAGQSEDAQSGAPASVPEPDSEVEPQTYPSNEAEPTEAPEEEAVSDASDGGE